ncbi:MAG: hypothetical protein MJZ24_03520 [Paludibacteraceae bacterium]|nr:hypothetical protein [Candidatus Physcocola equi]MCQ2233795.1 hypothetical protein [Paludibacteraceae bacterium]
MKKIPFSAIFCSVLLLSQSVVVSSCGKDDDESKNNQGNGSQKIEAPENGMLNNHEYVDLGLPSKIKWATCNIGADTPADYGVTFSWGQTALDDSDKDKYSKWAYWDADALCALGIIDSVKDKSDTTFHTVGHLMPENDAASVNWGENWRMPTVDEFKELEESCLWVWTTKDNKDGKHVDGYNVVGPNGNTLFLPAPMASSGVYWSSSAYDAYACRFCISISERGRFAFMRSIKYAIRPVTE